MQKVIEAARNPTPFMQQVTTPPQPLTLPATTSADSKHDNKTEEKREKRRRSRSRSRDRRRDRSRDRSRDRKDRRRRDRSRSRDRKDRHRRDRSRSRNGSRTNDRSRSRERDSSRRDKKKDNGNDLSSASTTLTELNDIAPNIANLLNDNSWDAQLMTAKLGLALAGRGSNNFMGNFDTQRIASIASSNNDPKDGDKLNDFRSRDSWPPTQPAMNDRFERNSPSVSGSFRGNDSESQFNRNRGMFDMYDNRDSNQGRSNNRSGRHSSPYNGSVGSSSSNGYDQHNDSFGGRDRRDLSSRDRDREGKLNYPRPGCCVKVRIGRMGYGDVRRFFQGLFISNEGVKLINDEEGRRTGVALVRFVHPEGKMDALQRNGTFHRGNVVDVVHCDDLEFDNAVDSFSPSPSQLQQPKDDKMQRIMHNDDRSDKPSRGDMDDLSCVILSNLPPFTKEHDIITMIGDFPLVSVLMVMNKESQQLALLHFAKTDDAQRFCNQKHQHFINGQSIKVKQMSEKVFFDVKRQHNVGNGIVDIPDDSFSNNGNREHNGKSNIISDCIVLKGLPIKTSDRDIIDFFSDIGLVPSRIHVPLGKSNKPSFCYCEFTDPQQASQATTKNGTPLGMCEVYVELIPRREMEQQIGVSPLTPDKVNNPINNLQNNFNQFQGGNNMHNQRRPMFGDNGPPQRGGPPNQQFIPEIFRNPGCVISLENVPFRAGIGEIMEFFQDYNVPEENIMRRFNDRGHATGDARVAFSNPLEAQRAFSELRHGKIRDRTIFMHLQ